MVGRARGCVACVGWRRRHRGGGRKPRAPRVGRGSSSAGSSLPGARTERARPESERERETWWTHAPLHPPPPSSGCYAERVAVPAADAALAPTTISLTHAAAVPLVALTAVQTIEATPPSARARGSLALVHAGAGGVGHVAVQLLVRRYGMVVTATCGPANDAFVRACGAATTLDYRSPTFAADLAAAGPYHLIFDLIGGDAAAASRGLVAEGGAFAEVFNTGTTEAGSAANKAAAEASGGTYVGPTLVHAGDGAALKAIAAEIDSGKLSVDVAAVLPLAQAAEAHARLETLHVRGKIVLQVGDEGGLP